MFNDILKTIKTIKNTLNLTKLLNIIFLGLKQLYTNV